MAETNRRGRGEHVPHTPGRFDWRRVNWARVSLAAGLVLTFLVLLLIGTYRPA